MAVSMVYELERCQRMVTTNRELIWYKDIVNCVVDGSSITDNLKKTLFYTDVANAYNLLCTVPNIKIEHKRAFKGMLMDKIDHLIVLILLDDDVERSWRLL